MQITLKEKTLKSGKTSLYIEYYKGSTVNEKGKRVHLREVEYLKLYLNGNPETDIEKKENEENLKLANNILTVRRSDYLQGRFNIQDRTKLKKPFLEYYKELAWEKRKSVKNYGVWMSALKHLKICVRPKLIFEEVDEDFVKRVRSYFEKEAKTKSNLPISQNSRYTYFNKFKACLRSAFDEGYTTVNYAKKAKGFKMGETQREYLTTEELQRLISTPCKYQVLKNAFIFSCLTGLRWSDCNKLTWADVRDEGENQYRLNYRQEKTGSVEYLYISKQARELLGERKGQSERVFVGLKYSAVYNNEIVRWCNRAGVFKHITFHSARHTNAVLLLENGADIYTVQKRLGHKEIKTTAIYAKIVDEKMRQSANIIPDFNVELI